MNLENQMKLFLDDIDKVRGEFGKRVIGSNEMLDYMLTGLFAGGHILVEGLPGLGKTLMVKSLSSIFDLSFQRIQFTPDLMPSDILGTNILLESQQGRRSFHFEKGPIFGNIILADEINRASPKTQSALLQAMEELEVSAFGNTYALDEVFLTLATQNPIEMRGTYELPEAQLDRFMFKVKIPFPDAKALESIARLNVEGNLTKHQATHILNRERVLEIKDFISRIPVSDMILRMASELVRATHPEFDAATGTVKKYVKYGASPRGVNALASAARVNAVLAGRFNLSISDLEKFMVPCLNHRIILNYEGQADRIDEGRLLSEVFDSVNKRFR